MSAIINMTKKVGRVVSDTYFQWNVQGLLECISMKCSRESIPMGLRSKFWIWTSSSQTLV